MLVPKVSVIITVYNIEKYIGKCVESVLNQSLKDIEIICVDDASTDCSLEILEKYEQTDSRVRVIKQAVNVGPSTAKNIGYKVAQGEYLYQIDGDDYIVENALERMYTCAEENNLDLLTFSGKAFAETEEMGKQVQDLLNLYERIGSYDSVMKGVELFAEFTRNGDFYGNTVFMFMKKNFFDSNNLYWLDGLYAWADSCFVAYMKAQRAMCISDALYMRRFRDDSIVTSKKTLKKFESMLVQTLYEINVWKQYEFDEKIEEQVEKYFSRNWSSLIKTYNMVVDKDAELKLLSHNKVARLVYSCCIQKKNVYWTKCTNELIDRIRQFKNVIIYGTKDVAKEVKTVLEENQITQYIFAVSDNANQKSFEERKIYNIDELEYMCEDSIVIIAVNARHQKTIKEKLELLGFKNMLVVE